MIAGFYLQPTVLINSIMIVLALYVTNFEEFSITNAYTSPGYVTDNFYFTKATDEKTYAEATTYCMLQGMDLFTPTNDMRVMEMFGNFSTKKVWTQVYQHEVTKTLVNADQLPPTTVTLDKVMELPAIILPERYLVSLQMDEENKVFFSPTEIGTRLSTVCMGKIGYPNSTWERGLLETIKEKTKKILENSNDHAKRVLADVERKLLITPKLGTLEMFRKMLTAQNHTLNMENILDKNSELVLRINDDLHQLLSSLSQKWRKITIPEDLMFIMHETQQVENLVSNLLDNIWIMLENPIVTIDRTIAEKVNGSYHENWKPILGASDNPNGTYFFYHLRESDESSTVMFPYPEKFQVIDVVWNGFFKLSMVDLIYGILWIVNIVGYLAYLMDMTIDAYLRKKRTLNLRRKSNAGSFRVRKIDRSSRRSSFGPQNQSESDLESDSHEYELETIRPKKRPATSLAHKHKQKRARQDMYRPPQKPLNVPQWGLVRIINDNLPVADGASDISE